MLSLQFVIDFGTCLYLLIDNNFLGLKLNFPIFVQSALFSITNQLIVRVWTCNFCLYEEVHIHRNYASSVIKSQD